MRFKNITVKYGEKTVLKDFSADLTNSRITALVGPSGAGKTTLLKVAAGLLTPNRGSFVFDGKISVMFQEPRLLPWLTAAENVNLVLGDSRSTLPQAVAYLEKVGITETEAYPDTLSGGMKQRVALARALAYPSDLLLLDEPFAALDADNRRALLAMVEKDGRKVLFVTHNEEDTAIAETVLKIS